MASRRLTFRFKAPLVRLEHFQVLPVPDRIAAAWKAARVRRLAGHINGHPIKRALMGHADGGSFLIVNRHFVKTAGLGAREEATLAFGPDPTPGRLDLPPEFQLVLDQDDAARERWNTFTLGRRRSLLVYLTSARTEPTRIRRAVELARRIRTRTLYGDLHKKAAPAAARRPA